MENEKALNNAPAENAGNAISGADTAKENIVTADENPAEALPCSADNNKDTPAAEQVTEEHPRETEGVAEECAEGAVVSDVQADECEDIADGSPTELAEDGANGETAELAEDGANRDTAELAVSEGVSEEALANGEVTEEAPAEAYATEAESCEVTEENATENATDNAEPDETADGEASESVGNADTDDGEEQSEGDTEIVEIATELVSEDGTPTVIYSEDGTPLSVSETTEPAEESPTEEAEEDAEQGEAEQTEAPEQSDEQIEQAEGASAANEVKKAPEAVADGDGDEDKTVYNPEKPRFVDTLFEFTELFVFTLVGVLLVVTFLFRHSIVSGDSMENTLTSKDVLIISDFLYTPKVNDIVIIDTTSHKTAMEKLIVKRIIALEGQTVRIQADGVYVDGKRTSKEYEYTDGLKYSYSTEPRSIYTENKDFYNLVIGKDYYEITVPEGEIFVLGDHRNLSSDSRQNGTFDADAILGRALFRVYPNFGDIDSAE